MCLLIMECLISSIFLSRLTRFKNAIFKPFLLGTELRLERKSLLPLFETLQLSNYSSSASHSVLDIASIYVITKITKNQCVSDLPSTLPRVLVKLHFLEFNLNLEFRSTYKIFLS